MPEDKPPQPLAYNLEISGDLPGEKAIVAICETINHTRDTTDKALLARMDAVFVTLLEDLQAARRKILKDWGLLS